MSSHTKNFGVADLTRVCRCGRKDGDAFVCGISGNFEDLSGITDATQESVLERNCRCHPRECAHALRDIYRF